MMNLIHLPRDLHQEATWTLRIPGLRNLHLLLCRFEGIRRSFSPVPLSKKRRGKMPREAGRRKSEERETHPFDRPLRLRLLKDAGLTGRLQWWVRRQPALLPPRRIFCSDTCHPSSESSPSTFLPPAFRHLIIRGGTDRRREPCLESTEKRAALPAVCPEPFRPVRQDMERSCTAEKETRVGRGSSGRDTQPATRLKSRLLPV